jgi:AcrR family transcriptional regulator
MGKSLTEVAKTILMNESNDPAPDRDAKSMTPLKASLKPGSAYADPSPLSNSAQDLGPALVNNTDVPPSAKASGQAKKDTSPSSQSRKGTVSAEPKKSQAEVMEEEINEEEINEEEINEDEEIEISEELEAFIDQCLEEGLSEEEIAKEIDKNFELVTEETETLEENTEESVMENYQVDMSEDIEALFSGEELSEEFRAKATAIFEAAVKRKLEEELAAIEEAYAQTLEQQVASIHEELSNNVDDYLNYVVENWMVENEVAIEAGLRTELTEDFISGLHNLFIENYIDIPEDKVSVIEEMGAQVEELTDKLNEEIERNVILNKMLSESKQVEVFNQMTEGLTATQVNKLKTLAEGITYVSVEEYAEKVSTLKESYFPSSAVKAPRELDLIEPGTEGKTMIAEELNGPMAKYVKALGKSLPK